MTEKYVMALYLDEKDLRQNPPAIQDKNYLQFELTVHTPIALIGLPRRKCDVELLPKYDVFAVSQIWGQQEDRRGDHGDDRTVDQMIPWLGFFISTL